jgi:ABC-type nickel/cobalt efflux system permease component RcnA
MNFYNDNSRKITKLQKILIIVSFIIIISWGIYFVIHVINTIENNNNNNPISNSFIYSSLSSFFIKPYFF